VRRLSESISAFAETADKKEILENVSNVSEQAAFRPTTGKPPENRYIEGFIERDQSWHWVSNRLSRTYAEGRRGFERNGNTAIAVLRPDPAIVGEGA
jgi:hypothetical protein